MSAHDAIDCRLRQILCFCPAKAPCFIRIAVLHDVSDGIVLAGCRVIILSVWCVESVVDAVRRPVGSVGGCEIIGIIEHVTVTVIRIGGYVDVSGSGLQRGRACQLHLRDRVFLFRVIRFCSLCLFSGFPCGCFSFFGFFCFFGRSSFRGLCGFDLFFILGGHFGLAFRGLLSGLFRH